MNVPLLCTARDAVRYSPPGSLAVIGCMMRISSPPPENTQAEPLAEQERVDSQVTSVTWRSGQCPVKSQQFLPQALLVTLKPFKLIAASR